MTAGHLEALYGKIDGLQGTPPDDVLERIQPFRVEYRKFRLAGAKDTPDALAHLAKAEALYCDARDAMDSYLTGSSRETLAPTTPEPVVVSPGPNVSRSSLVEPSPSMTPLPEGPAEGPRKGPAEGPPEGGYPDHPAAAIFPMMSEGDLADLAEDIREHGLQEAVTIFEGKVLDGRNRQRACLLAGVPVRYKEWEGEGSPVQWVVSRNLHRRHLTDQQRSMVAAKVKEAFAAEAEERRMANLMQNRAATDGLDPGHRKLNRSAQQAADELGVSRDAVNKATAILQHGDRSLVEAVENQEVSLDAASLVAHLPVEEQRALVEAGEVKARAGQMRQERRKAKVSTTPDAPSVEGPPDDPKPVPAQPGAEEASQEPVEEDAPIPVEMNPEEEFPKLWRARDPKFLPMLASLTDIATKYGEVLRLVPTLHPVRAANILVEFLGTFPGTDLRVVAANTANTMLDEERGREMVDAELADLPDEGQIPKLDALRVRLLKHISQGHSTGTSWASRRGNAIYELLHPRDDDEDE